LPQKEKEENIYRLPQAKEKNSYTGCPKKKRRKIVIQVALKIKGGKYFYRLPQEKEENNFYRLPQEKEENNSTDCFKRRRNIVIQVAPREGGK
jgi:hypothetical protein